MTQKSTLNRALVAVACAAFGILASATADAQNSQAVLKLLDDQERLTQQQLEERVQFPSRYCRERAQSQTSTSPYGNGEQTLEDMIAACRNSLGGSAIPEWPSAAQQAYKAMLHRHGQEQQSMLDALDQARFAQGTAPLSPEQAANAQAQRDAELAARGSYDALTCEAHESIPQCQTSLDKWYVESRKRRDAERRFTQARSEFEQAQQNSGGGGGGDNTAAVGAAATLAAMAAARAASEATTASGAAMIGRGGDIFVFCYEGPEGGSDTQGWYPISPVSGTYIITRWCTGSPCPNWQYIPAYMSLCPQAAGIGTWTGPGSTGSIGQYQSSGGSQYKGSPENKVNGLMPFMH